MSAERLEAVEREVELFRKFRADTCAARHPMPKPKREEGVIHADMQHCPSCGIWRRAGNPLECPFGWDR